MNKSKKKGNHQFREELAQTYLVFKFILKRAK